MNHSFPLKEEFDLTGIVIDQAPDAIIVTKHVGDIRVWNNRAVEIFGFSVAEALEGGLDLIIPEHLRSAHSKGFREAVTAGRTKAKGHGMLSRAVRR